MTEFITDYWATILVVIGILGLVLYLAKSLIIDILEAVTEVLFSIFD
jgi:hypothetical protein